MTPPSEPRVNLVAISITPAGVTIPKGETQQFTATGHYSNGTSQDLTQTAAWTSSDPSIISISSAGLATALAAGTVDIQARSGAIVATVSAGVALVTLVAISVTPSGVLIPEGQAEQFTATGTYSDSSSADLTLTVVWTSANPSICSVDVKGSATAIAPGQADIQAQSGGFTTSAAVFVEAGLASIAVSPASVSLAVTETQQFNALGTFSDSHTEILTDEVAWTSSAPGVVSINQTTGLATAIAAGSATIQVAAGQDSGSTVVTVLSGATLPVWPVFDVAEMAEEASDRAGIEYRSAYGLRSARRALEFLGIEWANRGLNLWTIDGPISVLMLPGVDTYDLPADTVDLVEHVLRQQNGDGTGDGTDNGPTDIPLERWTFSEYATIPNKSAQGRPSVINIRRAIAPYFIVWQVPDNTNVYTVVYWRLRRLLPLGTGGTGQPDIPWRFVPAMTAGLAFYLALKSKDPKALARVEMLKAEYVEQFGLASDEDRDRASFHFIPGGYDFLS